MKSTLLKDFSLYLFLQDFKILRKQLNVLFMENQAWHTNKQW